MVEQKTKEVSVILLLIISLGLNIADFNFQDEYYCLDKPEAIYNCESIGSWGSSEYGKCNGPSLPGSDVIIGSYKRCTVNNGWEKIIDDRIVLNETDAIGKEKPILMMDILVDGKIKNLLILNDDLTNVSKIQVGNKCLDFYHIIYGKDIMKVVKQVDPC